ncbi:uncharacterized protein MELLADRAFT_101877 [Melampsora larici-populina 98AG31]|uniref:Secreted protein n=1 Tax=Melampsora larici-populina (strain 98AG31 / pathotype 3-4-7) TaxID=747676 RepID=F4R574_MELLP|nr:uncharacterized protein MELLADRAFT_101877 [Melampsora larici-populina 98AG31]EGG12310.1 hypothetical protein MELLADRAFT_101877 [Melampsora larici-populina 98AG31]
MMHYLYLINTLLIGSIGQVICVSVNHGSMEIRKSISKLHESPRAFNSGSDSQNVAHIAAQPATQVCPTPTHEQQRDSELQELYHMTLNARESQGKKRKLSPDLNISHHVSGFQHMALMTGEPTRKPQLLTTPSLEKHKDVEIQSLSHLPLNAKETEGKKKKLSFDLNLPYDISWTESGNESPNHRTMTDQVEEYVPKHGSSYYFYEQPNTFTSNGPHAVVNTAYHKGERVSRLQPRPRKKALTNTNKSGIFQYTELQPPLASSSSRMSNARRDRQRGPAIFWRYTFKKSGESTLLADHRVRKIGERWHMVPSFPAIAQQLKQQGLKLAIHKGLHPEDSCKTRLAPWFHTLEMDMQNRFCLNTGSKEGSYDIHLAVLRANNYLTMQFLASLQVIHSAGLNEMDKLFPDGLEFIERFLDSWRQVKWDGALVQSIDTSKCLGTYTPLQILSHFLKSSRSSQLSLCISWSLCNDWYTVSTYTQKKKISFEDYVIMSHQYLARAEVFPELEVVPFSAPDMSQMKRHSLTEIHWENISADTNHYRTACRMMKTVGEKVLKNLLDKGSSLEFIESHCNHMAQKEVKWPHSWKGNINSLKRRVKNEVFPCTLGMIQLLYPFNNKQEELNPAVVEGFRFLKMLIKSWGEDDLERACEMESFSVKRFHKFDDAISIALLSHLMKLAPDSKIQIASSVFWGLWQVLKKMEGFKFTTRLPIKKQSDFIEAINKACIESG